MLAITIETVPATVWVMFGLFVFLLVCLFAGGLCKSASMGDEMVDKHRDQ